MHARAPRSGQVPYARHERRLGQGTRSYSQALFTRNVRMTVSVPTNCRYLLYSMCAFFQAESDLNELKPLVECPQGILVSKSLSFYPLHVKIPQLSTYRLWCIHTALNRDRLTPITIKWLYNPIGVCVGAA